VFIGEFDRRRRGHYPYHSQSRSNQSCHDYRGVKQESLNTTFSNLRCRMQIRMVAGFTEMMERSETLVAEACNRPNCFVLLLKLELIWLAA
jgi:hypothetical protein